MAEERRRLRVRAPGTEVMLGPGDRVRVGRGPECDVVVDDPRVSRVHGEIAFEDGAWTYRDLGSSNGSFRDGAPVAILRIADGAHLRLGSAASGPELRLDALAAPPPPPAAPGPPSTAPAATPPTAAPGAGATRIGRAPDNDLMLDDLSVSRYHAELRPRGGSVEIVDLGSFNGTFVNGAPVTRAPLAVGDVVTVGHHLFRMTGSGLEEQADAGDVAFAASGLVVTGDGGQRLLSDIGFALPPNSLMAVVGPSGAGKSTLLSVLIGARPPDTGRVLYQGRDLHRNLDVVRHRIGFVPQDDVLHPELTVRAALGYAAALRFPTDVTSADRAHRVEEVMTELGIAHRAGLPIRNLSGGQRKRTSVALELLTRPALLFLDEPTSGLDPGLERALMRRLRSLADGGRTIIVVTHSTESLSLCDRVLFLAPGGATAYFGPPQMALQYFRQDEYADVFEELDTDRDTEWGELYAASEDRHRFVDTAGATETAPPAGGGEPHRRVRRSNGLRQFMTLTARYLAVLGSDRRHALFLALQAVVLGVLLYLALLPNQFQPPDFLEVSFAEVVIVALVLGVSWIGMSNSIREVVKERAIYLRERSAGLSPFAYLSSKLVVLSVITALQAAVVGFIAIRRQGGPDEAALLSWPDLEIVVALMLAGLAAMTLGLAVSALVSTTERAMTIFPILLIVQLLFVGLFPSIERTQYIGELRHVASAQWGFSAVGSTVDLNELSVYNRLAEQVQGEVRRGDFTLDDVQRLLADTPGARPEWRQESGVWLGNIGALAVLYLGAFFLAWLALLWRDARVRRTGRAL